MHDSIHSDGSIILCTHDTDTYIHSIYMAHSNLFSCPLLLPLCTPLCPPLYSLSLTWHPPVVIGIVHLPLRLLVNWPRLPHPSSSWPTLPKFPEPHLPAPTMTTSGIFWLLVSRTVKPWSWNNSSHDYSLSLTICQWNIVCQIYL